MRRDIPPLNHLRALEVAIRHESFTKAAEEMHVTQGAISRHIRDLEEYLGWKLFERVNNNLLIPDETREFGAVLTRAFDGISRASQELRQSKLRTVLIVRSYTNLMMRWLIPRLPSFDEAGHGIELRLTAGVEEVDFEQDDIDVAFRYGKGQWDGLHADYLFSPEMIVVCTPELARRLRLERPEDVLRATVYHTYARKHEWPLWFKLVSEKPFLPAASNFLEDAVVVDQCVCSGMGVGLRPRQYFRDDIAMGRLVSPFGTALKVEAAFYLVFPKHRIDVPKVARFREWLLEATSGERESEKAPR